MADALTQILTVDQLQLLFDTLMADEYALFGPVPREYAIMYDQIHSIKDLPKGLKDQQEPGRYTLIPNPQGHYFSHTTSPDSWKKYIFPKEEVLYTAIECEGSLMFKTQAHKKQKRAFVGIRSCDIHAVAVQDRVFLEGDFADGNYAARRDDLFFIAVNCTHSVATCFCSSLNTGPAARSGYDIALTEIVEGVNHYFTAQAGSVAGEEVLRKINALAASQAQISAAQSAIAEAAKQIRTLPTEHLKETVYAKLQDDTFWAELGERCLHCANCTLVCPTCFCSDVEDRTDLTGTSHERVRYWDSCFNESHSHIVGGSVRQTTDSRYRQWFSHKLASWQDQFNTLGCTGCGRCVTWCPVGIDITHEAHRLLSSNSVAQSQNEGI